MSPAKVQLNLAENVSRLRGEMSYSEMARRLSTKGWKCYPATVEQIEKMHHIPNTVLLVRIANYFRVGLDDLISDPPGTGSRRRRAKAG